MERVSQPEVVRHWLRVEREKSATDDVEVDAHDADEALDAILRLNPGAAAFIWRDAPIDWYRVELPRGDFLSLRVVEGPEHLYWRALSSDNTIRGAAERIASEDPDQLAEATGVDVSKVLTLRDELPGVADREFVLSTRRGCSPWTIADGNYRAIAKALYLLEDGEYRPQPAYLAVGSNPVVRPLRERVCGLLRSARSKVTHPSERTRSP